jgi:hypothetical protein
MEESYKLKVKIGQHEFEAEGPQEAVERQFQTFSELIRPPDGEAPPEPSNSNDLTSNIIENTAQPNNTMNFSDAPDADTFKRVFHVQGDAVSLAALPRSDNRDADAALVILLGCQFYTSSPAASGAQMIENLRQSGISVDRADRVLKPYIEGDAPLIIATGIKRGSKYRLTNQGIMRARTLAKELADLIPL